MLLPRYAPVIAPGEDGYDVARRTFNVLVDQQPTAAVLPENELDVIAAVEYARRNGLRVVPQSTGHNAGPLGSMQDTLLVNVSGLDEVSIDAAARRVRVGAGVRWHAVTPELSDHGLAALHGSSPDVGIAGYSLGGGMGWLARKYGLQTNSVTAIELVTADGRHVRTDADTEPDLFWALRGGNGNFGVVTALEFSVYPVPEVYGGVLFFDFERAGDVLHAWNEWLPTLPDELMTWSALLHFPDIEDVPPHLRGGSYVVVWAVHQGGEAEGRRLLAPMRQLQPQLDTFAMVPPIALGDLAMDPRDPVPIASTHHLLGQLPASAIDDLLRVAGPGSDAPLAMVQLRHLGGALGRRAPGAGARATLPGEVCLFALGIVPEPALAEPVEAALTALYGTLLPHRVGDYPNFVEAPADASGFFDAATWNRLREVKAAYDPEDLFKGNHHIPPAA